eukprot:1280196-Pyramimonas_sp.AAC.1
MGWTQCEADQAAFLCRSMTDKSGCVTGTRVSRRYIGRFAKSVGISCLARELTGSKMRRIQERKRLLAIGARQRRLRALRRGAPGKTKALWRTGLVPAAAHGAGASGVTPRALQKLRTMAGALVGARSHSSVTAWLATQRDEFFDTVCDTTI